MDEPAEAARTIPMRLSRAIEIVLKYSGSPPIKGTKTNPTKAAFQCRATVTGSIALTRISESQATPAVAPANNPTASHVNERLVGSCFATFGMGEVAWGRDC